MHTSPLNSTSASTGQPSARSSWLPSSACSGCSSSLFSDWVQYFIASTSILQQFLSPWLDQGCDFLQSSLSATGPVHPITLFTSVSLLTCIAFSLFCLCLRKQPHKSTSYQVSTATLHWLKVPLMHCMNDDAFCLFQMSDQPAEGTFTDADRSTVTSATACSVQFHLLLWLAQQFTIKTYLKPFSY